MTDTLRSLRIQNGLTQTDLAKLLNVDTGSVGAWEKGTHKPNPKRIPQLAEVLGVTPRKIFLITDTTKLDKSNNESTTV